MTMTAQGETTRPGATHFVGVGHSHIVALANGAYELQAAGATFAGAPFTCRFHYLYAPDFEPNIVQDGSGPTLNPAIVQAVEQDEPRFYIASVGGNEHNVLSIVQLYQRYDFILGDDPGLPLEPGAEIIPESVIRETLREWMEPKIAVLRAIRARTPRPIAQIEPPAPLPRAQVLAHPKEFFRKKVDLTKLSPDMLRHKMWRLQTSLYREICAELDVLYIEAPPEMIGPDNMLARHVWGGDATHANDLFGQKMVERALRRIEGAIGGQN